MGCKPKIFKNWGLHLPFKLMHIIFLWTFDIMRWQGNCPLSADWLVKCECLYKLQDIQLRGICKSKWEKFLLFCFFLPAWWPSPPVSLSSHHYFLFESFLMVNGYIMKFIKYESKYNHMMLYLVMDNHLGISWVKKSFEHKIHAYYLYLNLFCLNIFRI